MPCFCPACNGLLQLHMICPACGTLMLDGGTLADYQGPYSPYVERSGDCKDDAGASAPCIHLLYCPVCGTDRRLAVALWRRGE